MVANLPSSLSSHSCMVRVNCFFVIRWLELGALLVAWIFWAITSHVGACARRMAGLFNSSPPMFLFIYVPWGRFVSLGCRRVCLSIRCRPRHSSIGCGTNHIGFFSLQSGKCPKLTPTMFSSPKSMLRVFTMLDWRSFWRRLLMEVSLWVSVFWVFVICVFQGVHALVGVGSTYLCCVIFGGG